MLILGAKGVSGSGRRHLDGEWLLRQGDLALFFTLNRDLVGRTIEMTIYLIHEHTANATFVAFISTLSHNLFHANVTVPLPVDKNV